MNQTEQVTSITPLEAAAKAIFSLQQQATDHTGRIEQLETCAVINAETIGHVAELRRIVTEQGKHIERLKRDVELNSGLINCLQNVGLKDNKRIERLETALGFSDGSTYTAERAKRIEDWGGGSY